MSPLIKWIFIIFIGNFKRGNSLSPYGEKGHEKDKTGYDATAWWARSGLMHAVRSNSNSEPNSSVPGMGDHPTASALFGAIMMALYKREITGEGSEVSSSLMANGLWSNGRMWYFNIVGEKKCPIVDTWWQTETGATLISPLPGATDLKPGSASKPLPGVRPALLD